ncbi:MAG: hypothetical protein AABZ39_12205 [Spirochaetota bacterium]
MKVIGIDPAPKKGLTIFGDVKTEWENPVPINRSREFIKELKYEKDLLVCWDSPLTGPPFAVVEGNDEAQDSDYTQRPIEHFSSCKDFDFKANNCISVNPYSGLSHWTISRSLIGLPRTGPYDNSEKLPFSLISDETKKPNSGLNIVEVHPALAMWLWLHEQKDIDSWKYKGDHQVCEYFWKRLLKIEVFKEIFLNACHQESLYDDNLLDARIAYALGCLLLKDNNSVIILGNLDLGTFLLPNVKNLGERFRAFIENRDQHVSRP